MPDFLVIGAARSATTSLHYYLQQHPSITMSRIKEPNFFAFDHRYEPPIPLFDPDSAIATKSIPDRGAYERLFAHARPGDRLGEASPLYLYVREAPGQIREAIPGARLVAVLRDPIDRAYSHWMHIHRDRPEAVIEGFRRACDEEMASGTAYTPYASGTHVLRMGLYDQQLARYVDTFGREPLLVLTYESLTDDPGPELQRVCEHVGVAPHAFDTGVRYNRSGVTTSRVRARLGRTIRAVQPAAKALLPGGLAARLGRLRAEHDRPRTPPPVPDDLRERLVEWFSPSVERLRGLDVVDVSHWDDFR